MSLKCPAGFDSGNLRKQVLSTYDRVAREPEGDFHFHRGADYACEFPGYEQAELDTLPRRCTARFAGVGNPHRIAAIEPGNTVLDHACGAGMDLLLAARKTGPTGKAIGIDMPPAMREAAAAAAREAGLEDRVEILAGFMEDLPVPDESVDALISNGVVNLAPDKRAMFREIQRVLIPGGRLLMADVVVARELSLDARNNPDLWAACVAGAMVENEIAALAKSVGLVEGMIVEHCNCFRDTPAEGKVASDLQVHGINFFCRKP